MEIRKIGDIKNAILFGRVYRDTVNISLQTSQYAVGCIVTFYVRIANIIYYVCWWICGISSSSLGGCRGGDQVSGLTKTRGSIGMPQVQSELPVAAITGGYHGYAPASVVNRVVDLGRLP